VASWPTVFIDRYYEDDFDTDPPWPRRRRWPDDAAEWQAYCEYGSHAEEAWFDDVDHAIAWGRERAQRIFVRLGADNTSVYVAAGELVTVDDKPLPSWPPDKWPRYEGPAAETRRWPLIAG
jgi:hypothetical protein